VPPQTRTITLVAMNDFHGALYEKPLRDDPTKAIGGLPWLEGALDALRADAPDLVLLDAGDAFQGDWPVNVSEGIGAIEAFNLLGVDASAVGNHEFDYGPREVDPAERVRGALEEAARQADYPLLTSNVFTSDGTRWQPEGVTPWTLVERGGVRLAVVGLTTAETPTVTSPENVADLTFADPVESVRALLPEIEAAHPDAVVIVGHLTGSCEARGYLERGTPCTPDGEIGRLLAELPPGTIDVIVAGHAHTLLAERVADTFILENRAQGHLLGRLDLVLGTEGVDADASVLHEPWALVHSPADPGCEPGAYRLDAEQISELTVHPSAEALELVRELEARAPSLCEEIRCATAPLLRDRNGESAVGDLVTDAMLAAFPEADVAIQNSGGLRSDLPAGPLRLQHAHAVMPFDNQILLVEMTGEQLTRLLRIGSSGAHGLLQIAGGTYRFDASRTTGSDLDGDGSIADWERDRLCGATVSGAALDPAAIYLVATTDFLHDGGDHLGPAFSGTPVRGRGPLLRDALVAHLRASAECIAPPAASSRIAEGRCGP
jgi:5'-nucleotidase